MRRALFAAIAAAAVLVVAPAAAGADVVSLGGGLGITSDNGPVLSVTQLPPPELQILLSDGSAQTCASSTLLPGGGLPSCVAVSAVSPSTPAQISAGQAQLSYANLYFNAQAVGFAGATGRWIIENPYTHTAYLLSSPSCSALLSCGQSMTVVVYNAGTQPAPIVSAVNFNQALAVLPAVQAGASTTLDGTLNGGFTQVGS